MLQGEIPDGEGLKFRVAGFDAVPVLVIELAQAGRHFAAAGARCGDDHQLAAGLDIIVLPKAVFADDVFHIQRIAVDGIVVIAFQAQIGQPGVEGIGCRLSRVPRQDDAPYGQPVAAEGIDQTKHIQIVSNAEVSPDFILFDIVGVDHDDDLRLIGQLHQHADLAVWLKTRQDARCMIIIEELSSEFHIELSAELVDTPADHFRLFLQIQIVVKSYGKHNPSLRLTAVFILP